MEHTTHANTNISIRVSCARMFAEKTTITSSDRRSGRRRPVCRPASRLSYKGRSRRPSASATTNVSNCTVTAGGRPRGCLRGPVPPRRIRECFHLSSFKEAHLNAILILWDHSGASGVIASLWYRNAHLSKTEKLPGSQVRSGRGGSEVVVISLEVQYLLKSSRN